MAALPISVRPHRRTIAFACLGAAVIGLGLFLPSLIPIAPPNPATAADGNSGTNPDLALSSQNSYAGGKIIVGIAVIAGGCLLAIRLFKRKPAVVPGGAMELYSALAIDAQCTVSLVRAGTKRLLIGYDSGGVKAMIELPGTILESDTRIIGPIRVPAMLTQLT